MSLERQRRRLMLNRLQGTGPIPPAPRSDRVTRIGNRDGRTGLWEVIHPDGSVTLNGIKTFNTGVPYGSVVLGIPRDDGFIALAYRNQERPVEAPVENPYLVVALIRVTPFPLEFGDRSTYWLKVGDNPPQLLFEAAPYTLSTEWLGTGEARAVFIGVTFWSYLGDGIVVADSIGDQVFAERRDVLILGQGNAIAYSYSDDEGGSLEGDETISYPASFNGFEGWIPKYKWIPDAIKFGWDEGLRVPITVLNDVPTFIPYYGEQEPFTRQYFRRGTMFPFPVFLDDIEEVVRTPPPPIAQAGFVYVARPLPDGDELGSGYLLEGQSIGPDDVPLIYGQSNWNVGRSLIPYTIYGSSSLSAELEEAEFLAQQNAVFRQPLPYPVFSRPNNELFPVQVGDTAPFMITAQEMLAMGVDPAVVTYYTEGDEFTDFPEDASNNITVELKITDAP